MRGGILSFSTNIEGLEMKKIQIQNTQNRYLQILSRWVIRNQCKTRFCAKFRKPKNYFNILACTKFLQCARSSFPYIYIYIYIIYIYTIE